MPRLSQRLSGAKPDGPYDGMPAHLLPGVIYWLESACGYRGGPMNGTGLMRLAAHMGVAVETGTRPQFVMQRLHSEAAQDETFAVDLVDGALDVWNGGAYWELNNLLVSSASIWRVNENHTGLVRAVSDEAQATYSAATSVPDEAAAELRQAWSHAFGRNGDPSDAWDHAIKAVEDVLIPAMMPGNLKATLSNVKGELAGQNSGLWQMVLPGADQTHDVAPLVALLSLMWPNHDRHGGAAPKRTPTEQEARAAVTLAATIVQWHRDGWVVKKR